MRFVLLKSKTFFHLLVLSHVWIAALLLNLYSSQTCKLILSPIWQDFTLTMSEMEYLMKKLSK